MSAENLRSVVTGGVAFTTPNDPEAPAPSGSIFVLHERPEEKWLGYSPHLEITNTAVSTPGNPATIDLENVSQTPKQQ